MSFRDYEEFGYQVIALAPDGVKIGEYIALTKNIHVARAAFFAILPERPRNTVLLMERSRIVLDSRDNPSSEPYEAKVPNWVKIRPQG